MIDAAADIREARYEAENARQWQIALENAKACVEARVWADTIRYCFNETWWFA